ncbi:hypothetical protein [Chishuiella sp.]|uniref:hypothetical protein n=1 Tax=Chishuiella sp. TaxID=1969467 RepID=UPI0028AFC492|nr:hypothetical protein [Chishuiella sp.]
MKSNLFILTVVLITCRPFLPVLEYLVNYDKIITELCVNRDRPELDCNGFCYLKKEVSKTSEDQQKDKIPRTIKSIDFFVYNSELKIENIITDKIILINSDFLKEDKNQFLLSNLLQPPIV